jgi:cytochrome P450
MIPSSSPPAHPLWGHLPAFSKDPLRFLTDCARGYGRAVPLRLLHVPAVLLLDPADIERVLVTEHRDFVKPAWLRTAAVRRLLGSGLVTSDGDDWRRQRQACQPAFHLRRMGRYGEAISALAEQTLARWNPGDTLNLQREMSCLTLEVIARTLLNVDKPGWTKDTADAMDTLMARFSAGPSVYGMAPLPPSPTELRAARRLNRIVDSLIDCNLTASQKNGAEPDLLSLLRKPISQGGEGLTGRAARDQVKTFLGAGYESSALTLTWAFLLLARHPEVEEALAGELDRIKGGSPTPEELPCLPIAQSIVKETLRLFPPLWMTGREAVRAREIGGVKAVKGALIMTSQWAVQRHPSLYHCPDEFRPDRWLNGETSDLPRFAYFPFGGGPRVCIGQSFAMMESVLLLAAIARRFRLEPIDNPDIRPWATMTLRPPAGIRVRLSNR